MDGGAEGFSVLAARLGDEHPVGLGVLLFGLFAETSKYLVAPPRALSREHRRRRRERPHGRRFWVSLSVVLLLALFARTSVVEISRVVGPSMEPTLNVRRSPAREPRRLWPHASPFSKHVVGSRTPRRGDVSLVFAHEPARDDDARADEPRIAASEARARVARRRRRLRNAAPSRLNGWLLPVCDAGPFASTAGTMTARRPPRRRVPRGPRLSDGASAGRRGRRSPRSGRAAGRGVFVAGDDRSPPRRLSRLEPRPRRRRAHRRDQRARLCGLPSGRFAMGASTSSRVLSPLDTTVREPEVDLRRTAENVAACLGMRAVRATWPPPDPSGARALERDYKSSRRRCSARRWRSA